jgi:hypothetical protein
MSFTTTAGLASAFIFGSKSRGTLSHILLCSWVPFPSRPTTRGATGPRPCSPRELLCPPWRLPAAPDERADQSLLKRLGLAHVACCCSFVRPCQAHHVHLDTLQRQFRPKALGILRDFRSPPACTAVHMRKAGSAHLGGLGELCRALSLARAKGLLKAEASGKKLSLGTWS